MYNACPSVIGNSDSIASNSNGGVSIRQLYNCIIGEVTLAAFMFCCTDVSAFNVVSLPTFTAQALVLQNIKKNRANNKTK